MGHEASMPTRTVRHSSSLCRTGQMDLPQPVISLDKSQYARGLANTASVALTSQGLPSSGYLLGGLCIFSFTPGPPL